MSATDLSSILGQSTGSYLRQGTVSAFRAGPPPVVDVSMNCEGEFSSLRIASGSMPVVGDTVWVMQQNGRYVVMGIQQNTVPLPPVGEETHEPTISGGTQQGPTLYNASIRQSDILYSDLTQPKLLAPISAGGVFTDPTIVGGTFTDLDITDARIMSPTIFSPVIERPELQSPVIIAPSLDGNVDVVSSGNIKSANYSPGAAGWAIDGQGRAEFNDILVRNSGMIGGVALGLTDMDGVVDGGSIASQNYSAGNSGWAIDGNGNAEFNDVTLRGSLQTTNSGTRIEIGTNGNDEISFYDSAGSYGYIEVSTGTIIMSAPFSGSGWKFAEYSYNDTTMYGRGTHYQPTKDPSSDDPVFRFWANTEYANASDDGGQGCVVEFIASGTASFGGSEPSSGNIDTTWMIKAGNDGAGGNNLFRIQQDTGVNNGVYVTNGSNFVMYGNVLQSLSSSVFILRSNTGDMRLQRGASTTTTLTMLSNSVALGSNIQGIAYNGTSGTGSANKIGFKWSSPNIYGRVDNVVQAVVGTVSDRRLKDKIKKLDPEQSLLRVLALSPVDFLPLDLDGTPTDSLRRPGLVADEVDIVESWAVPPVEGDELQTVDYLGLVGLLVSAVQGITNRMKEDT